MDSNTYTTYIMIVESKTDVRRSVYSNVLVTIVTESFHNDINMKHRACILGSRLDLDHQERLMFSIVWR